MKIIHISDLHFGTEAKHKVDSLIQAINTHNPDVIVVTGDFTQRALHRQYKKAQNFLKQLNCKQHIYVPGNHDISLHNPIERFFYPFNKFQKYIAKNMNQTFCNDKIALLAINSVTPYRAKDGYITTKQLHLIREYFKKIPSSLTRILIMHHNLIRPETHNIIANSEELIKVSAENKISLILSGHLHDAWIEQIHRSYFNHNLYVITAGTGLSYRLRTQPNSFNYLEIGQSNVTLRVYQLTSDKFINLPDVILPL